jgi:hypothetical protein
MSTQNISTAAIHVVGQYNDAGKTLVSAYRAGAHRLLGGAASRYSDFLGKRATKRSPASSPTASTSTPAASST